MTPVWYNARKAAQVVAFFARAAGGKINVLKLTKLVYLADRLAMERFESPILKDKFVSMDHGPVNSITLNFINGLAEERQEWNELVTARYGHFVGLRNPRRELSEVDELSMAEIKILAETWETFGYMNPFELRDYTHHHCPEWEDPHGSSEPIPVERIFKFLGKPESATLAADLEAELTIDHIFAHADALPAGEVGDAANTVRAGERPGAQAPLDHTHRDMRPRREPVGMHQVAARESVF